MLPARVKQVGLIREFREAYSRSPLIRDRPAWRFHHAVRGGTDAGRVGLAMDSLKYGLPTNPANGTVYGAGVVLDRVELGGFVDTDVRAVVNGGRMNISLLGMAYLDRFRSFSVEGDRLLLSR